VKEHVTPVELEALQLPTSFRGYSREAVDAILRRVASDIEAMLGERQSLVQERNRLEAELERHRAQEAALRDALVAAEQSAKAVRENAEQEARLMLEQAAVDAKETRRSAAEAARAQQWEAERLRAQNEAFRLGFRALLREHLDRLEGDRPAHPLEAAHAS
jgi:cell division initiation protein